jgi:hypothetical protein
MTRPQFELADIVRKFGGQFVQKRKPNEYTLRILNAITQCRTSEMGGHNDACEDCGQIRRSYNSCGNRHCPKCQASKQAMWIDDLIQSTLEVKHFHVVFTLPHELNDICLLDSRKYYNQMFASVWDTLRTFGYTHFGVESGAVSVLHTWGQNLSLHPHMHCIVPAAGLALKGNWKNIGHDGEFLYPVEQLSPAFRSHFMNHIKLWLKKQGLLKEYQKRIDIAWDKPWVVHCEPSLAKPEHVIKYLGQYTHRVAISNDRILNVTDTEVTFIIKDYADDATQKPITLNGIEFLRRFCMHILPHRFVKIRRYGIYNPVVKESTQERMLRLTGFDVNLCPFCKTGKMHRIEELPKIRSPSSLYAILYNTI